MAIPKKTENQLLAIAKLWLIGVIAVAYLRLSQLDIYELLNRERFAFIEAARRFGKTTSILCFVAEKLLQNPGWICRWCFPFKNQAREVLLPEMEKLQKGLPDSQKFIYTTTDSVFIHPNGSKLFIRGVNEDKGESARGPASNIIVADEYGFWNDPQYIIREVLAPQLENQEGRWLIKASTPPKNLGHIYYVEREEAVKKGRFIQKTIYQNEALGADELQEIIEECGGIDSPSFQRERLCMPVSDPKSLIIPEFKDDNIVPDDYQRPDHFDAYVGGDSGADDNTALLFGYYDFLQAEIVIEDEIVVNGLTTKKIILLSKIKELYLWNNSAALNYVEMAKILTTAEENSPEYLANELKIVELFKAAQKTAWRRVYDAGKQLIYDILGDHKYQIMMPNKADKQAAVHELRVAVGKRKFKLKKRCAQTIWQFKVGMWKDEKRNDFERTEGLGHLDAIAAAIYFNRAVDKSRNPYPQNHGLSRETHFISPNASPLGQSAKAFKAAFGGKSGRFR